MGANKIITVLLGASLACLGSVSGAEFFVSKQGSDANNGTSKESPFLTVQKGVDALNPGDTLTIGPGEYTENVFRADLGNSEVDTVIRAELPRTVVLRGDEPAPEFSKVEGYRFVYSAPFDREPEAVMEHATMRVLEKKPNAAELEFEPGSLFYDTQTKTLFISSADQLSPAGRLYTVSVNGGSGLHLESPTRVIIEGICATGYYRTMARRPGSWVADYQWGIILDRPESCTVRDSVAYLNCGGIGVNNGRGNTIEDCVAHDNVAGNIQYYGGNNHADNVVRNCYAYRGSNGIDSYTLLTGPMLFQNNIAWGHSLDYSTKSGNETSARFGFMEGCVALSNIRVNNLKNSIFGGRDNEYGRGATYTSDNVVFAEEENLNVDREFADPVNMDWRLQADSRFRGAREDGKDRGVFPERNYRIFFLNPAGNDESEGSSMQTAWKTLGRALRALDPGDTLYLAEGIYRTDGQVSVGRVRADNIRVLGRGRDRVVIDGELELTGWAGVELERLHFAKGVTVRNSERIEFKNCSFGSMTAEDTKGLKVTHSLFSGDALRLAKTAGVYLSANIYANAAGPAVVLDGETEIVYSDYNSYQNSAHIWTANGEAQSLDTLRPAHGRYSLTLEPEFSARTFAGLPELDNTGTFAGRDPQGTSLGRYQEYEEQTPSVTVPFLHSVSDTTANIEWWASAPATCGVAWGETPEMRRTASRTNPYRFASFSLTGLEPGRTYHFEIRSLRPSSRAATPLPPVRIEGAKLSFTTAKAPLEPEVYYVAPDGDDANNGLSRAQAWRTVGHAAAQANAGDTVMVAGGTYREMVRLRASGTQDRPILFRSIPGPKVVFDGDGRSLSQAFVVLEKEFVHLDGFYFKNYSGPVIEVEYSRNVQVTRCFSDGRGPGYAGPLLSASHSEGVTARNCVSIAGMGSGMNVRNSPNTVIENNVFLRNLIYGCVLVNEPDDEIILRKNVFADSLPFKAEVAYMEIGKIESLSDSDNCYYMRLPDEERKMFMFYGVDAYERAARAYGMRTEFDKPPVIPKLVRMSLRQFKEIKGETGSYLGNPWFKGSLGMSEGETTQDRGKTYPVLLSDKLVGKADLDFPDLFAADPKAVEMGVGLVPEDFADFGFENR